MEGAPAGSEITGKPEEAMLATMLLNARTPVMGTLPVEDIPEKVVINKLEKKYQPVEMPHRKIVQALVKGIGDNKLAANFHADPGTFCQGCHHNSPLAKKPPQCGSCHGQPFNEKELNRPRSARRLSYPMHGLSYRNGNRETGRLYGVPQGKMIINRL
jgi:hypothetical protein